MHSQSEQSFFLTNKIGASPGDTLGLINRLSNNSTVVILYKAFEIEPDPSTNLIRNSIPLCGGTLGNFLGKTSGYSQTTGISYTPRVDEDETTTLARYPTQSFIREW